MKVDAGKLADLPEGKARVVQVGNRAVAIFKIGDSVYAIDDNCSHRAGPLSEGLLEGLVVRCPWHGARFDLRTGEPLCPPATRPLRRYSVTVNDEGTIFVEG